MKIDNEVLKKIYELSENVSCDDSGKKSRLEERVKELEKEVFYYRDIVKINSLISSSMSFENIQKEVLRKIKKYMKCEYVNLYIIDSEDNQLYSFLNDKRIKSNEQTFIGSCSVNMSTIHVQNASDDIRSKRESKYNSIINYNNVLLSPIISKGKCLGVIQCINSSSLFSHLDIKFLNYVATQLAISIENINLYESSQKQFFQICSSMAEAISVRDKYTGGHIKRVENFAELIGIELELSEEDLKKLKLSALLHDVGKIGIADNILKKEGRLSSSEYNVMMNHPKLGFEILEKIDGIKDVIDGVKYHHERIDGTGYPYGLEGDNIPVIAQIISVVDAFDAMITDRPYRKSLSAAKAYKEIIRGSGKQFSPRIVLAFKSTFKKFRNKMNRSSKKYRNVA